jgi:hypothetical protein
MRLEGEIGDPCHLLDYDRLVFNALPTRAVFPDIFADLVDLIH